MYVKQQTELVDSWCTREGALHLGPVFHDFVFHMLII